MFNPFLKKLKNYMSPPELSIRQRSKFCDDKQISSKSYPMSTYSSENMKNFVYDLIKTITDPEKPYSLEELNIVYEEGIEVSKTPDSVFLITVEFTPTISHCNLATMIGLCIRVKLKRHIMAKHKLLIQVKKGSHITEDAVNKQINDKERVAAAMENPSLQQLVEKCIEEVY